MRPHLPLALRYAISGTGWYVRGMTAFAGQSGACVGGPRSVASGAQPPKCSRMRRMTFGPSISAIARIGPLHLGHAGGSASYALRISCADTAVCRVQSSPECLYMDSFSFASNPLVLP